MIDPRLPDFLEHMQQAAADAMAFTEGMSQDEFLSDKRTAGGDHEPDRAGRGGHQGNGPLPGLRQHPCADSVAQHARHAQPHCARLFRHQSGDGVGHGSNRVTTAGDCAAEDGLKPQRPVARVAPT